MLERNTVETIVIVGKMCCETILNDRRNLVQKFLMLAEKHGKQFFMPVRIMVQRITNDMRMFYSKKLLTIMETTV